MIDVVIVVLHNSVAVTVRCPPLPTACHLPPMDEEDPYSSESLSDKSSSSNDPDSDEPVEPALSLPAIDDSAIFNDSSVLNKVHQVLNSMAAVGITLPEFLDAVSWGNAACIQDGLVRGARTNLMTSPELPRILRHWWNPPASQISRKQRSKGAKDIMEAFAQECLKHVLDTEMDSLSRLFRSPAGTDVTAKHLTSLTFTSMIETVQELAPTVWDVLFSVAVTSSQSRRNRRKNPIKVSNPLNFSHPIAHHILSWLDSSNDHFHAFLCTISSSQSPPEIIFHLLQVPWSFCKGL